jgi:hypothetical protein
MPMLDGELRRTESQFVRIFRPGGYEQLAVGRLAVDPNEPTGGITLEPNRSLPDGEYLLSSMSGSRDWPVILRRSEGTTLEVHRFPPKGPGR